MEPLLERTRSQTSRAYYDALAAQFDEMDHYWSNPYDTATWRLENELISRFLDLRDPALDLGVGFYPHVESTAGAELVNLDISQSSLIAARRAYHEANNRMSYVCADALTLPFRSEAFRALIAGGELINHVSASALLAEMSRVLRPGGRVVVSVAMKWCLDSLWAVIDAFSGGHLGYAMTPREALAFLRNQGGSSDVTWEVTPEQNLQVTLYSVSHLKRLLERHEFAVCTIRALNVLSGVVPLPWQQDPEALKPLRRLVALLLRVDDGLLGRLPGLRWFAGNVYLVLEKR